MPLTAPYATELIGVYQPLIGWRGATGLDRAQRLHQLTIDRLIEMLVLSGGSVDETRGAAEVLASRDLWRAFVSPVGVVHFFRRSFFELGRQEGPPVAHVWVSGGGTVELVEINTLRSREERTLEASLEATTRLEARILEQEELSSVLAEQSQSQTSLGLSASFGFGAVVVHGDASASYDLTQSHSRAETTTRRHMREQTDNVVQELNRNYRTTFREVVESEATSSRRHIIQNPSRRLVNYELRRKFRHVGIQLRRAGTQLCWQTYVDNPGAELRLPTLLHVGMHESGLDLPPPPTPPPTLPLRETTETYDIPWHPLDARGSVDRTYVDGESAAVGTVPETNIQHRFVQPAVPPEAGYVLQDVFQTSFIGSDPQKTLPLLAATYQVIDGNHFEVVLRLAAFYSPSIRLSVKAIWAPPSQSALQASYAQERDRYVSALFQAAHYAYLRQFEKRVTAASCIRGRSADVLREEERRVVFTLLVQLLMQRTRGPNPHVLAELIRGMFDIDRILYFVAPGWFLPRRETTTASAAEILVPEQLAPNDVVTSAVTADPTLEQYFITPESEPAPLGASLGWTLQLDGDALRNAFINTPWIKAIVPIRSGRETEAIDWLRDRGVEGSEGADGIEELLDTLASSISTEATAHVPLAGGEVVYENGFERVEVQNRLPDLDDVLDQWVAIAPTDQVVAVEYTPEPHGVSIWRRVWNWLSHHLLGSSPSPSP